MRIHDVAAEPTIEHVAERTAREHGGGPLERVERSSDAR
jgi:hypothetical protein